MYYQFARIVSAVAKVIIILVTCLRNSLPVCLLFFYLFRVTCFADRVTVFVKTIKPFFFLVQNFVRITRAQTVSRVVTAVARRRDDFLFCKKQLETSSSSAKLSVSLPFQQTSYSVSVGSMTAHSRHVHAKYANTQYSEYFNHFNRHAWNMAFIINQLMPERKIKNC